MEKTKYRYKCMICGTEVVSADDMLSCSACGSDELAKFEIAPAIDIVEKKPPKKQSRRRKPASSFTPDVDILSLRDFDPAPPMPTPMPMSIPPYRRFPPLPLPPSPPPPPPPPPTKWERIRGFMAKAPRWILSKIKAPLVIGGVIYGIPLVIGGVIYYMVKFFI